MGGAVAAVMLLAVFLLAPFIPLPRYTYEDRALDRTVSPSCVLLGFGKVHAVAIVRGLKTNDFFLFTWNSSDASAILLYGFYHNG